ncbi:MAG: hypothetical protein K1X75_18285 [Leptospirales bacterium]|nr:hypothetical protein [Leptospirales bacterium]
MFEYLPAAFPLILLLIVATIFGRLFYNSTQRRIEERALQPIFEARCAGQVGAIFYRGPFIRFSVYPDFLIVAVGKAHLLRRASIRRIYIERRFWQKQLVIEHLAPEVPEKIRLLMARPAALEGWGAPA